jgi:predicted DNA repair protein MutK
MLKKGKSVYRQIQRKVGKYLLAFAPKLMRTLSVVGTLAMFMVGGSIIGHGIPAIHHWSESMAELLAGVAFIATIVVDALVGLIVGAVCLSLITLTNKILPKKLATSH